MNPKKYDFFLLSRYGGWPLLEKWNCEIEGEKKYWLKFFFFGKFINLCLFKINKLMGFSIFTLVSTALIVCLGLVGGGRGGGAHLYFFCWMMDWFLRFLEVLYLCFWPGLSFFFLWVSNEKMSRFVLGFFGRNIEAWIHFFQ